MFRGILLLFGLLCTLLTGCSLSPEIDHQAVDYFQANDLAANQIILLNILRAKDGAPLHFSELAQIRGQLSVGASGLATFPFGPIAHATTLPRQLATLGVTVSSAPSFDISSLDTKDFTDGVMAPITPQTTEFFLNEGIDYRMVLLLLVSGIRPAATTQNPYPEMLLNAPESSRRVCYTEKPKEETVASNYRIVSIDPLGLVRQGPTGTIAEHSAFSCPAGYNGFNESEYYAFLRQVDSIKRLYPVSAIRPPRPVGPPFALDMDKNLRAIAEIDPTKYRLVRRRDGQYQLMSASHGSVIALCEDSGSGPPQVVSVLASGDDPVASVSSTACDPSRNIMPDDDGDDGSFDDSAASQKSRIIIGRSPGTFTLQLRSALEVIQYVGQVLAFQQAETEQHPNLPERCITVEPAPADITAPTCSAGPLFHLDKTNALASLSNVSIDYGGQYWALPPPQPCNDPEGRCDHTLETMSMISLLLNQNKSAKDIATTPAVQTVP